MWIKKKKLSYGKTGQASLNSLFHGNRILLEKHGALLIGAHPSLPLWVYTWGHSLAVIQYHPVTFPQA